MLGEVPEACARHQEESEDESKDYAANLSRVAEIMDTGAKRKCKSPTIT